MKQCPSCGNSCYDAEMFCSDCGTALPSELKCVYCGASIVDIHATHCSNCHSLLELDYYPPTMGTIHCTFCGKARPVMSKYCPACGIATENAPQPRSDSDTKQLSSVANRKEDLRVAQRIIAITVIPTLLLCIVVFLCLNLTSAPPKYVYSYVLVDNGVIIDNNVDDPYLIKNSEFRKVNVDDFDRDTFDIECNDIIEITGVISNRSFNTIYITPSAPVLASKEGTWEYELRYDQSTDIGKAINGYYVIGDTITVRARVLSTRPSATYFNCEVFDLVE